MLFEGTPASADELKSLVLYNYGHFTSMLAEEQRVRGLSMHLDRLAHDSALLFGEPVDPERVRRRLRGALGKNTDPVVARVTVFSPDFDMSHPGGSFEPKVLITTRAAPSSLQASLKLKTTRYERDLPAVKHVGLFGALQLRRAAQLEGYDDVLFVDEHGFVSEGATWNIAFVKAGQVIWPQSGYLSGVTMRIIRHALIARGIESIDQPLKVADLGDMDTAFITNAAVGVRAVSSIDSNAFDDQAGILTVIREAYLASPWEHV